jgi:RNA polymerase sigma factor (sigma-70 family)
MALRTLRNALRRVHAPAGEPPQGGVSDAALLERFVRGGDEAAFELLVWRHGPMVLGACRRVLRHEQDAEDAFQATFLTLARKAGEAGRRGSLGGWLYTVAYRVALRARQRQAARGQREGPLEGDPAPSGVGAGPVEELARREVWPVLDAEVARLPEKYRAAFVLCYLEGKTNEEAAALLGCPKGTILSRLARARDRLRRRLAARDLVFAAGPFAVVLAGLTRPLAEVSPVLVSSTAHAALLFAVGKSVLGLVSAPAVALAEGMVRSLVTEARLRLAATVVAVLALLGFSAGFAYGRMPASSGAPSGTPAVSPIVTGGGCHPPGGDADR